MTKSTAAHRVDVYPAVVYYDATHKTKNGKPYQFRMYFLDDCYIVVSKDGGDVFSLAFTDLTTARYEMNQMIKIVERES